MFTINFKVQKTIPKARVYNDRYHIYVMKMTANTKNKKRYYIGYTTEGLFNKMHRHLVTPGRDIQRALLTSKDVTITIVNTTRTEQAARSVKRNLIHKFAKNHHMVNIQDAMFLY